MIQNKHNGPALHTFIRFFSKNEPCHPNRVSLTDDGSTQDTPKRQSSTPTRLLSLHNGQGDGLWILPKHDTESIYSPRPPPFLDLIQC